MIHEGWKIAAEYVAWGVAVAWIGRMSGLVKHLTDVVDLSDLDWENAAASGPSLTVVVPAKDEAETLRATLEALAVQEYRDLRVMVVDDRSTDATGAIAEEFAAKFPGKFEALHVTELAEGWLGKTFAMEVATQSSRSDYVLFTDADILFSPSMLRRAMTYAVESDADHVVVMPTPLVKTHGEGMLLGAFQVLSAWGIRLWKVSDPKARRDVAGVGAFNLVRREAWEELGGWAPQRMVVLEDITVGLRMKAAGKRQRVAFAPGMVLVHWAAGMRGLVRVMTKNLFSAVNFRPVVLLLGVLGMFVFCLAPFVELFWLRTLVPALLVMLVIASCYRVWSEVSWMDARYGWLFPVGAAALMVAMLRSMAVVLWQGGVTWRGTFYGLAELRRYNSPRQWEKAAIEQRRKVEPSRLRRWVDERKRK